MNREEKRAMMKNGASKETVDKMSQYNSNCTIAEAVQIARASAEDVVEGALSEYQRRTSPLQVALSLQVEILKSVMIDSGAISEEEFREMYVQRVNEFNAMQKQQQSADSPNMAVSANDIEVIKE